MMKQIYLSKLIMALCFVPRLVIPRLVSGIQFRDPANESRDDRVLFILLFVIWINLLSSAQAANNLYEADLAATTRELPERELLFSNGLEQVIVKLTHQEDIKKNSKLQAALAKASNYVSKYTYYKPESQLTQLRMKIQFDKLAVTQLLQHSGLSYSENQKMPLVLWLAVETNQQRHLLSMTQEGIDELQLANLIDNASKSYGVHLVLPLLDLQDMQVIQVKDVWSNSENIMRQANQRYGTELFLNARLEQTSKNTWQAKWVLYTPGRSIEWLDENASLEGLFNDSFKRLNQELFAYSGQSNQRDAQKNQYTLTVNNIAEPDQLVKVSSFMKQMAGVDAVDILKIGPDRVTYQVTFSGDRQMFGHALELTRWLQPESVDNHLSEGDLIYRYIP